MVKLYGIIASKSRRGDNKLATEEVKTKAQTAFIRARISLMQSNPFWAHLVMKLPLVWLDDVEQGLSATDGANMYINPAAFIELSKDEQKGVLVHEVLHCAAGHLFRVGARDRMLWNIAGDIYIANLLETDGFTVIQRQKDNFAKMGIPPFDTFKGDITETIYHKLEQIAQKQAGGGKGKGKGQSQAGNGQCPIHGPHWNGSGCYREPAQGTAAQSESQWRQNVIEAGQMAGNAPGAWSELVRAAMPKVPFSLKLYEYLNRGMGGDTSFDSFNRRYLWQGLYLPMDTRQVMGRIAWVNDTSGSMGKAQLEQAFGYGRAFREQHPCQFDLILCDYDVADHRTYEEWEPLPSEFQAKGRGGTSFDAPFALLKEKRIDPKVVIYVTDAYGSVSPEVRPSCPVLWVVVGDNKSWVPPFGEVCFAGNL
jgi:predicted metal-dependent peptidase